MDETLYCASRHIRSFHRQAVEHGAADWGEPCAGCKYAETCGYDWYARLKPLFDKTGIQAQLAGYHKGYTQI